MFSDYSLCSVDRTNTRLKLSKHIEENLTVCKDPLKEAYLVENSIFEKSKDLEDYENKLSDKIALINNMRDQQEYSTKLEELQKKYYAKLLLFMKKFIQHSNQNTHHEKSKIEKSK